MGFRSLLISEDTGLELPSWFVDKYLTQFNFYQDKGLPMSSKFETKMYGDGIYKDIQKIKGLEDLELVLFHECGGITKVKITPDSITYSEPIEFSETPFSTHSYCYGCSEPRNEYAVEINKLEQTIKGLKVSNYHDKWIEQQQKNQEMQEAIIELLEDNPKLRNKYFSKFNL